MIEFKWLEEEQLINQTMFRPHRTKSLMQTFTVLMKPFLDHCTFTDTTNINFRNQIKTRNKIIQCLSWTAHTFKTNRPVNYKTETMNFKQIGLANYNTVLYRSWQIYTKIKVWKKTTKIANEIYVLDKSCFLVTKS